MSYKLTFTLYCNKCDCDLNDMDEHDRDKLDTFMQFKCPKCGTIITFGVHES